MNRLERKQWILVGILVIVGGGAAFVFFDPLGLDLLGGKQVAVVKPVAAPRVAAPAARSAVVATNAASAPVIAPVSAPSAVPSRIIAPVSSPAAASSVAKPPVATPALQLPLKSSQSIKSSDLRPTRSKSADLRDCLKLETDPAIAKCAGE